MIPDYEQRLDDLFCAAFVGDKDNPAMRDWVEVGFELKRLRKNNVDKSTIPDVRPEVERFAIELEQVLQKNDHTSGWDKLNVDELFLRIRREFDEFYTAYLAYCDRKDAHNLQNIRDEALDMSNFCMFLCHNCPKREI